MLTQMITNLVEQAQERRKQKAREQHRQWHQDHNGCDYKCTSCGVWWSSLTHTDQPLGGTTFDYPDFGITMNCGRCGGQTHFNCEIAPVAIHCDATGRPINE